MEINKERVIAYKLAKEINAQDLMDVSGGANPSTLTQKGCMVPTGQLGSLDLIVDAGIDW
jgi:hypothetical protein